LPPSALIAPSPVSPTGGDPNQSDPADGRFYLYLWAGIAITFALGMLIVGIDDMRLRIHQQGLVPAASVATGPTVIYQPPPVSGPVVAPGPAPIPAAATAPAIAIAAPPPPIATSQPVVAGPFAMLESVHPYRTAPPRPGSKLDAQIGTAIQNGADYLISQFSGARLRNADSYDADTFDGVDTLCVYALLRAGESIDDPRLNAQSELMNALLERIKTFPMTGNRATYSRSLRISALTMLNRPQDRDAIEQDYAWLLKNVNGGGYTYSALPANQTKPTDQWDNSNSQYGALGMWAASDAGLRPLGTYWEQVTQHWEDNQVHSGGWGYSPGSQSASLAMTAAGVSILFAARDQTAADAGLTDARPTPLSRSITLGLEWLDEGDHAVSLPGDHPGYTLYGLERAGLASGYKFFGDHNWFLELATQTIAAQQPDGSWPGGDVAPADTAFRVLFLARGRPPILMNKLRFDGDWAFRPRDVANLAHFASKELERPLNWQVVGLDRSALEWNDCPVLYIASPQAPTFSDEDVAKLHDFVEAGGLIFTQSIGGSDDFDRFAADLARRMYPSLSLTPLPAESPLYTAMFQSAPSDNWKLSGLWNGARLLMVHCSGDLSRQWHARYEKTESAALQLGTNIAVYAAGRSEFRNRTDSIAIPAVSDAPIATVPVARVRYGGNWDPEPGAWKRMSRLMQFDTGVFPETMEVNLDQLTAQTAPLAHLTGTGTCTFTDAEVAAARQYITDGGVLFIDSCGGSKKFSDAVEKGLLSKIAGDDEFDVINDAHPLLNISSDGMLDLTKPRLRLFDVDSNDTTPFRCRILHLGKGDLIVTDLDVTSGLLGTHTWGIRGYRPGYAEGLMKNLILWTMKSAGRIAAENPKPEIRNPN
jgi:hypothetical protein